MAIKRGKNSVNSVQIRHRMEGLTSVVENHRHAFGNLTDLFIPDDGSHRHTFQGITTTADGHRHNYSGRTGLAINGQGANHFHRFRILTRIADGHRHIISGRTSVPIRVGSVLGHKLIIEQVIRQTIK